MPWWPIRRHTRRRTPPACSKWKVARLSGPAKDHVTASTPGRPRDALETQALGPDVPARTGLGGNVEGVRHVRLPEFLLDEAW
ncbi:MAG: hypothetical protein LBL01_01390 [Bifidobacteriaceae bacterium]|jgi:hypothetical protein|nr:hypothetical protein [Bifidobacteriaceae bacterium]